MEKCFLSFFTKCEDKARRLIFFCESYPISKTKFLKYRCQNTLSTSWERAWSKLMRLNILVVYQNSFLSHISIITCRALKLKLSIFNTKRDIKTHCVSCLHRTMAYILCWSISFCESRVWQNFILFSLNYLNTENGPELKLFVWCQSEQMQTHF